MKKSFIKALAIILVFSFVLSGCVSDGNTKKTGTSQTKDIQAVFALNPMFYLDGESVVAFDDLNKAIYSDATEKTLTSLTNDTEWKWASRNGDNWRLRSVYGLSKWHNGNDVSDSNLKAYSYADDGSVSLMCYDTSRLALKPYGSDTVEKRGVLMSVSGADEECLTYEIPYDGVLDISSGKLTLIDTVGKVKTGFMDTSDGSIRNATVKLMINNSVIWCGEVGSAVGESSEKVTTVEYPDFSDLYVEQGDVVSVAVQINGNADVEIFSDYDEDDEDYGKQRPDFESDDSDETDTPTDTEEKLPNELSFVNGYLARFDIIYPENISIIQKKYATTLYNKLEMVTGAEYAFRDDSNQKAEYEILIGETNRAASKKAYSELRSYRKNCASDFIVRMDGKDIVIAAISDIALENAINYFADTYIKTKKSKVPTSLNYINRPKVNSYSINNVNVINYVIRTEKYPSILTKRAAKKLSEFFVLNGGVEVPVSTDQTESKYEILVGFTERSGISKDVFKSQSLDYVGGYSQGQYKVYCKDGKLFVNSGSDYAANYAVELIIKSLMNSSNIPSNYTKKGTYSTSDPDVKYGLSDGYGLAWSDEFFTSDISGNPIENNLDYWVDNPPGGGSSATTVSYKPESQLVKELLELDLADPLRKMLLDKETDASHGAFYQFGKIYQPGKAQNSYGVKNNMLFQTTKFDNNGFWTSRLDTNGKMDFRYGIFETRAIFGARDGASDALWFGGAGGLEDGVEIDLFENFGSESLTPNLHTWANYKSQHTNHGSKGDFKPVKAKAPAGEHFYDTFHYLGFEWNEDFMDFYLDGEIYCSVDMTNVKWNAFEQKIFIYSTLGVTGGFYQFGTYNPGDKGGINELLNFEVTQYMDYIRIFQKNGERQKVWDYVAKKKK